MPSEVPERCKLCYYQRLDQCANPFVMQVSLALAYDNYCRGSERFFRKRGEQKDGNRTFSS